MKRRVVFAVCNSSARHIFVVNREALFIICNRPNVFASPVCGPARVNNPAARRGIRVPYVVYSYRTVGNLPRHQIGSPTQVHGRRKYVRSVTTASCFTTNMKCQFSFFLSDV
jgi:hypothetical protein